MAHSVSSTPSTTPAVRTGATEEPSAGMLVQSAMADMSTLVRSEIELAKAEVGKSAKKAGIGAGAFGAAAVVLAFSGFFFGIALAEFLTWLGIERWISYLIVWFLLVLLAGLAALLDPVRGPVTVAVAALVVCALTARAVRRFGGVTGDVFGAAIELTLAVLLVGLAGL